jgi:hypothetical protein
LLPNPDFKVERDASGKLAVAGWTGLVATAVSQAKGGPLAGAGFSTLTTGDQFAGSTDVSAQIPFKPDGSNYVFSGWWSGNFQPALAFLDANGKNLSTAMVPVPGSADQWRWMAEKLVSDASAPGSGEFRIPKQTAFIQVTFNNLQPNSRVAGFSLRRLPTLKAPTLP